jgi:hypothetical protein
VVVDELEMVLCLPVSAATSTFTSAFQEESLPVTFKALKVGQIAEVQNGH